MALSKKSPYVQTSNRVSGLMLANNTSIRVLPLNHACMAHSHKLHARMHSHTQPHMLPLTHTLMASL